MSGICPVYSYFRSGGAAARHASQKQPRLLLDPDRPWHAGLDRAEADAQTAAAARPPARRGEAADNTSNALLLAIRRA